MVSFDLQMMTSFELFNHDHLMITLNDRTDTSYEIFSIDDKVVEIC